MKIENYLLGFVLEDYKRETHQNRHYIHVTGIENIFRELYNDIKSKVKKGTFLLFISSKLKVNKTTIHCWLTGYNPIPLVKVYELLLLWKKTCKKSQKEFNEKWNEIYNKIKTFHSKKIKNIILPKKITEDIAYLTGFIVADGYIKNTEKLLKRGKYPEHSVCMYDNSKIFLEYLKKIIESKFNIKCNLHFAKDKKGSLYALRCTASPVHRFFSIVLEVQEGDRTGKAKVPSLIKNASWNIKKAFIAGFCDGEGGVGISTKNPWLEIAQNHSKKQPSPILNWIKKELEEFDIFLNGPQLMSNQKAWRLRASSKGTICKFYNIVSSFHPDKIKKFEEIKVFSYGKN